MQANHQRHLAELREGRQSWMAEKHQLSAELERLRAQQTVHIGEREVDITQLHVELEQRDKEHLDALARAVAEAREQGRAEADAELVVKQSDFPAYEGHLLQVLEALQNYPVALPNKQELQQYLSNAYTQGRLAREILSIYDEAPSVATLCADPRAVHILQEAANAHSAGGDAELQGMVANLQSELAAAEAAQAKALSESHQVWAELSNQLLVAREQLEQAHSQGSHAAELAAVLAERVTELESSITTGGAAGAAVPAVAPGTLDSLQAALREAITEQVSLAEEVATLEADYQQSYSGIKLMPTSAEQFRRKMPPSVEKMRIPMSVEKMSFSLPRR